MLVIPLILFLLTRNRWDTFCTNVFGIICLYLASHLILDLFDGGVSLFYPLSSDVFFINAELRSDLHSFTYMLDYGIRGTVASMGKGEPLVSSENTGIAVFLALIAIILAIPWQKKKIQR